MVLISLRAARVNAGLTQEDVHQKTGIARSTLLSWESGRTQPRPKNLNLLCALYKINSQEIKFKQKEQGDAAPHSV